MAKCIVQFVFCCLIFIVTINGKIYNETHRLQVHFSVPRAWANDPNGLIFYHGYYHLFYQHNPLNTTTGPTSWGHARSTNMIHWQNLPIALSPVYLKDGRNDIFSGCCVIDERNLTGFAQSKSNHTKSDVLLAIYTHNSNVTETQAMSYSNDNGITWTEYDNNPIIMSPGEFDFRDPNIMKRDGIYYMALAVKYKISFYSSTNLITWHKLSDFGVNPDQGDKSGVWECPSLFSLKDEQGNEHDILIVSENAQPNSSVTQYFIGQFDGKNFRKYNQSPILWLENGFDNYAAIPMRNDPFDRISIIGWMSNWLYARDIPTNGWRGQMTIPRELSIKTVNGQLYIGQRPIDELNILIDRKKIWSLSEPLILSGKQTINLTEKIPFKTGSMLIMEYVLDIKNVTNGKVDLRFGNKLGEFVSFNLNITTGTYEFDRRYSGNVKFNDRFADRVPRVDRISTSHLVCGKIVLDVASIEIFADHGLNTFSSLFFPSELYEIVQLVSDIGDAKKSINLLKLKISAFNSIWK